MNKVETKKPSKLNEFGEKLRIFFRLDSTKKTSRRVASSLWSIIFGILISLVFIGIITKSNPFKFFTLLFEQFKLGEEFKINFFKYFVVFALIGVGSAIGFKSGLFNIGISGQMMSSGIVSYSIFIMAKQHSSSGHIATKYMILAIILTIVVSFCLSAFAGVLKAYLNVHEVITTILLNWIVVCIAVYLFTFNSQPFGSYAVKTGISFIDATKVGTKAGAITIAPALEKALWILAGIFVIAAVCILTFIYSRTTIGYKLKMLGISKTNGAYMGVNDKLTTVLIMGISGIFCGLGGFYYFVVKERQFIGLTSPHALGFEAIAIALLALNSPIGVVFTSLFYSLLYNGQTFTQLYPLYLPAEFNGVVTALILYLAAISQMFLQFKPIHWIWVKSVKASQIQFSNFSHIHSLNNAENRLEKKYSLKLHKLDSNINESNKEQYIAKYEALNIWYQKSLKAIQAKRAYYENKVNLYAPLVDKQQEIRFKSAEIRLIRKDKNLSSEEKLAQINKLKPELISLKQSFKELKQSIKSNVNEFKAALKDNLLKIKQDNYQPEFYEFKVEELSKKNQIKVIKKDLRKSQNELLSKAMDYRNSNVVTINSFINITEAKRIAGAKCYELGMFAVRDIKQKYVANNKIEKTRYSKLSDDLYLNFMNEVIKPTSQTINIKGGAK